MNKLVIVLLSLVLSSVSFAGSKCEALLDSANSNLEKMEEALEGNEKLGLVLDAVSNQEKVSCEDLNSAIQSFEVITDAGAAAAKDMGAAANMKCKIDPLTNMKAEEIFEAYMKFEYILKQLLDYQTAGNCK